MKIFKTILISLLVLVVIGVIASIILITNIKRGALPKYEGELKVTGLTKEVTVYRDERGMPLIYAENEHDLYFARYTHRGPVISGYKNVQDAALSMKWSGYDWSDEIRTVCFLNRASVQL